jgi:hypothetical protein
MRRFVPRETTVSCTEQIEEVVSRRAQQKGRSGKEEEEPVQKRRGWDKGIGKKDERVKGLDAERGEREDS